MSFIRGDIGESLWKKELQKNHTNITSAPSKKFYDWDIKATFEGVEITYEVKYDTKGHYYAKKHNRGVNLYIEYQNTRKNEKSGIRASKADYYVYILEDLQKCRRAYVFNREELLRHLEASQYKIKGNKSSGDNNAMGWIPPLEKLRCILKKEVLLN